MDRTGDDPVWEVLENWVADNDPGLLEVTRYLPMTAAYDMHHLVWSRQGQPDLSTYENELKEV